MKSARKLLGKSGIAIFIVLVVIGIIKDYLLVPVMSKVWGITLTTTPDGYVSNANALSTVIHSPWILLVGFLLLAIYVLFGMWETSAAILGISYAYQGHNIKLIDLFRQTGSRVRKAAQPSNWPILIFAAVILPVSNLYQANEMIGAFVVPEYIDDYIKSKTWLWAIYILVGLIAVYIALRCLYLLPSFVMKNRGFMYSKNETLKLTRKGWLREGIRLGFYGVVEAIRLGIIPGLMILITIVFCMSQTIEMDYCWDVMRIIGFDFGIRMTTTIIGRLVYISIMCALVTGYIRKLEEAELDMEFDQPELKREAKQRISVVFAEVWVGILMSVLIGVSYTAMVYVAQDNPELMETVFGRIDVFAHKGYSSQAPENTMPAFDKADKSAMANYIELDVWSAKDGVPVVIHNETIQAATGKSGNVYDYTSKELHKIKAPYSSDPKLFKGAYIPTLEEVLAAYSSTTPILIEIKGFSQDEELPAKIVELMDKYDCKYTSMIHSQSAEAIRRVKMIDPDIRCGLILAFVSGEWYDFPYVDFYSVEHTFLTRSMVNQVHLRGKKVLVWTVNDANTAESLRMMAVDGIITDYPDDMMVNSLTISESVENMINSNVVDLDEASDSSFENGDY